MKKISIFFILLFFVVTLYAADDNLYEMFEDYPEIKIYVKDVINEAEDEDVKTDIFRNVFYDVMKKRKEIKFVPVDSEEDADVVIISRIKDYFFKEKAIPIRKAPLFINAVAVIADTAEPKSQANLVVDYEVLKPLDNKCLFSYNNLATETRKPQGDMTAREGFACAASDNINRFLFRTFYK